jgi:AcrR family transcriptional regulator
MIAMANATPRRADFHDNRERLLEAAQEIISERGPGALSISEVARRSGLNRTTAHAHFATRADLVAAVKQHFQSRTIEMLSANMPLDEWIEHVVTNLTENPGMHRFALHDLLDDTTPPNREGWHRYSAWMEGIAKEQGRTEGPAPEFMAQFLIAIIYMWPLLARVQYEESELPAARTRLVGEIKRLLLYGFIDPERAPEMVSALVTSK